VDVDHALRTVTGGSTFQLPTAPVCEIAAVAS
jgi:hypothetical protein